MKNACNRKNNTNFNIKIFLTMVIVSIFTTIASAETYKIGDISYNLTGRTKEYALKQNLDIDTTVVFKTQEELDKFLEDLRLRVQNQRVLKESSVTASYSESDETGLVLVNITITASDTANLFFLPYPKFSSDSGSFPSGSIFKLKLKDYNFLGLMNPLDMDFSFELSTEDSDSSMDKIFGFGMSYDMPIEADPFDITWENDMSFDFTVGNSAPEYDISSGVKVSLPFRTFSLDLTLTQSNTRNLDYEEYGDEIYFTENEKFAIPITVGFISDWGKVTYTPYISFTQNWDFDGISSDNDDLYGNSMSIGQSISTERINWYGNFRNGASISGTQEYNYNITTGNFVPYYSGDIELFKATKYVGFSMRLYSFQYVQSSMGSAEGSKIGSYLRGIRDDQKFDDDDENVINNVGTGSMYALKTPLAVIFNFDMPVKLFTTNWMGLRDGIIKHFLMPIFHTSDDPLVMKPFKVLKYFDFEFQLSPFADFALGYNRATQRTFAIADGFYAAGLEALIYPEHWRSMVVRASCGIDIGRKFLSNILDLDTSWRKTSTSTLEIYIGIGLHY